MVDLSVSSPPPASQKTVIMPNGHVRINAFLFYFTIKLNEQLSPKYRDNNLAF
jgi:hypothetical protein